MLEIGPKHPIEYRHEILAPFFHKVQSTDSVSVIGAASMGKTRLLDHLMRPEVQKYYLGERSNQHWLIRVDMNRMPVKEPAWAFYELLISSILLDVHNHGDTGTLEIELTKLDADIIQKRDPLLALRYFELIIIKLCQVQELKICFLLDEFDESYKTLPREIFLQLRGVRDANKNRISFVMFLRDFPERLRSTRDNESFYELLSRESIGIGPYEKADAIHMILQLEARKRRSITSEQRERICQASGGHPGLILTLFEVLTARPSLFQAFTRPDWAKGLIQEPAIQEECRKIWDGLSPEDQQGLLAFQAGNEISPQIKKLLLIKGLLKETAEGMHFFNELFGQYIQIKSDEETFIHQ